MFASHLILGLTLIGFAIWLQRTEAKGWPNESYKTELDIAYLQRRMKSRRRVNFILGICGVLILAAGVSGPTIFMMAWLIVTLALMTVVVLAGLDVWRTHRYLNDKLPEIRRDMLNRDD